MIFVTVGTQKFQFNRLLKEIDRLIEANIIKDNVVCQVGYSTYIPKNYEIHDFFNELDYLNYIKNCKLLITHAGVGTILTGKKYNKPIIVVPRLEEYGEHVDNHQLQIAEGFADKRIVFECRKINELERLIKVSRKNQLLKYNFNNSNFVKAFEELL